jgi:hypothetical protein
LLSARSILLRAFLATAVLPISLDSTPVLKQLLFAFVDSEKQLLRCNFLPGCAYKIAIAKRQFFLRHIASRAKVNQEPVNTSLACTQLLYVANRRASLPPVNSDPFPSKAQVVKKAMLWANFLNYLNSLFAKQIVALKQSVNCAVYV